MNEIPRQIKWIEQRIEKLNTQHERSIAMNSKIKEARALVDKVHETQKLIDQLEDPTERYLYQEELDNCEFARREIISPEVIVFDECNC